MATARRFAQGLLLAGGVLALSACHGGPHELTVTTTVDGADAAPGDGVCEMTAAAGDCSLRAAIDEANATEAAEMLIVVPAGTYQLTAVGADDTNAGGDLDVTFDGELSVQGDVPGAVIDAAGSDGALQVLAGETTLSNMALTGATGPGLHVASGAAVSVARTSMHDNGGAGLAIAAGASANALNSTFSSNADGGVRNDGALVADYVTVTANQNGGIVGTSPAAFGLSVVADQGSGPDCALPAVSRDFNLASDASCALTGADDVEGVPATLGPLGPTALASHRPLAGSPAIDSVPLASGQCGVPYRKVDQLGLARPQGAACDRGAVEVVDGFVVDTAADTLDADLGDDLCADISGRCSLRAAMRQANASAGADAIVVAPGVDPVLSRTGANEDLGAKGDLDVTGTVTIDGLGATVDAGSIDRVFHVRSGGDLTLARVTLTGGSAGTGGGIRVDAGGSATIADSTFATNIATGAQTCSGDNQGSFYCAGEGGGGAIWTAGPLLVERSTFVGNSAQGGTGCTTYSPPPPPFGYEVTDCSWGDGGAIWADGGSQHVVNSTFVENRVDVGAGGAMHGGTATLSTFVDNWVDEPLSLVASESQTLDQTGVAGSLVKGPAPVCNGGSNGHNVVSDTSCGAAATDLVSTDPLLGPLAANGGPTETALPWANAPGVARIPAGTADLCDGSEPTDQRGVARPSGQPCDAGAVQGTSDLPATALSLVVDDAGDAPDLVPGDRICASTLAGACTLRAAIDEANAWPGLDHDITIAPGIDPVLTRAGKNDDANATGDLDVRSNVTVHGGGAVIDAAGLDRAFDVLAPVAEPWGEIPTRTVALDEVTVTGGRGVRGAGVQMRTGTDVALISVHITGNLGGDGGGAVNQIGGDLHISASTISDNVARTGAGVWLQSGTLTITDTTFATNAADNSAGSALGGAIRQSGGSLAVERSLFDANTASSTADYPRGGGLEQGAGSATLTNVTMTGNRAIGGYGSQGGAISASGVMQVRSSTITGGTAAFGAGVRRIAPGAVTLTATVLEHAATDCSGAITSGGHNLSSDTTCPSGTGDIASTPALLDPLADNGGPTLTRLPTAGSPVLDVIAHGTAIACDGTAPTDQRGVARPQGTRCDIGAVEVEMAPVTPLDLTVDSPFDLPDSAPGDGICDTGAGTCTIRAAIDEANAWPGVDAITVDSGVEPVLSIPGAGDDANVSGDLDITDPVTIDGQGAVLDGAELDRVLDVTASTDLVDLTVTGGLLSSAAQPGGGIRHGGGELDLLRVRVTGNVTTGTAGDGAGLYSQHGQVTIESSTFDGNRGSTSSWTDGGAIWTGGPLAMTNSTLSNNLAAKRGSALGASGSTAVVTVTGTTISRNGPDAVLSEEGAQLTLGGTVVETEGRSCYVNSPGTVTSAGYNVVSDTTCGLTGPGDVQGVEPKLTALADHGGPTPTHLLASDSPALDAIPVGTLGLCDGTVPADQRGGARPQGGACDAGAVEGDTGAAAAPLTPVVDSALDAPDADIGDGICDIGDGTCTLRAAVDETNAWPGTDEITLAPGIDPVLSISGADEDLNQSGDLDLLDDITIAGGGGTIDGGGLDRVLHIEFGDITLTDIAVTGGLAPNPAEGGGLLAEYGDVSLDATTFSANQAGRGGAVRLKFGQLTVADSSFTGNSAASAGGAISMRDGAIAGSTFVDNEVTSGFGGALTVDLQDIGATVTNSTFVANHASSRSGAIDGGYYYQAVTITASTFIDNTAASGAALDAVNMGTTRIGGSVLVGSGSECGNRKPNSTGYNVVDDASCVLGGTGDQNGIAVAFAPLADNGGPTQTALAYLGAATLDAIPPATPGLCDGTVPTDQRGVPRPQGAGCDIGATEGDAGAAPP